LEKQQRDQTHCVTGRTHLALPLVGADFDFSTHVVYWVSGIHKHESLFVALWCLAGFCFGAVRGTLVIHQQFIANHVVRKWALPSLLCLSYNLLLGQGGMLSFGHAVYSGMGSYVAIHALNAIGQGSVCIYPWCYCLWSGIGRHGLCHFVGLCDHQKIGHHLFHDHAGHG
jgi:branched-chain amino acid transport system permease protein